MSIAIQSQLFGAPQGNYVNDLASVAGFPASQQILKISKILVHHGEIVDGLEVTYLKKSGGPVTVAHGGKGGSATLVELLDTESIVGVYGRYQNPSSTFYGNQVIAEISFVIANINKNVRDAVRVAGPFGQPGAGGPNFFPYSANGSIIAIGSYSGPEPYLHGLTFFKAYTEDITAKALDL
jgi:hypothetical protein